MAARMSSRARLQAIISGRLRTRSTMAPAKRPRIGKGTRLLATSRPTAAGPAWKVKIASVGSARMVTWLPTSLTLWPPHRSAKSRSRHTGRFTGRKART
jgi:hypothetical protein